MSRGHDRERAIRKLMRDEGWVVLRAAGSLGVVDLVALRAGMVPRLVEIKSTAGGPYERFGPRERAQLSAAARQAGAEAWLAWWPPRRPLRWIPESAWPRPR
jgi:Holliday junction resolvase